MCPTRLVARLTDHNDATVFTRSRVTGRANTA
jgi:hypothetical protein